MAASRRIAVVFWLVAGGCGGGGGEGGTGGAAAAGGGAGDVAGAGGGIAGGAGGGGGGGMNAGGRGGAAGTNAAGGRGGAAGRGAAGSSGAAGRGSAGGGAGTAIASAATIFYLDVAGRVMTADAENPSPRVVVASAGQGPDGIAIDVAAGHVFWTGMGSPSADDGFVMRANLDGSNVTTLVAAGGTYTPKQMRVDVAGGKLYWSDREGMKIQRANVDGSNVETLVTVATGATARMDASNWCVGMALDTAGGWFYWTQKGGDNAGVGSIRRAHIVMPAGQTSTNRTDIEVLFAGLPEPIDIELDVEAGLIYWADRGDDTINRAPIAIPTGQTSANRTYRQILVRSVGEAIGVAIDKPRGRLYYTSAEGQLGRANLDGTGKQELTGAGALTGIVVVNLR